MNRRTFIAGVGMAATIGLSGCSGSDGESLKKEDADLVVVYDYEVTDGVHHPEHPKNRVTAPHASYRVEVTNQTDEPIKTDSPPAEPMTDMAVLTWATLEEVAADSTEEGWWIWNVDQLDTDAPLEDISDEHPVFLERDTDIEVNVEANPDG